MDWFFGFAILYTVLRAAQAGYKIWKKYLEVGYNTDHFEKTDEVIELDGSFAEGALSTLFGALGLILMPSPFWIRISIELGITYTLWYFLLGELK